MKEIEAITEFLIDYPFALLYLKLKGEIKTPHYFFQTTDERIFLTYYPSGNKPYIIAVDLEDPFFTPASIVREIARLIRIKEEPEEIKEIAQKLLRDDLETRGGMAQPDVEEYTEKALSLVENTLKGYFILERTFNIFPQVKASSSVIKITTDKKFLKEEIEKSQGKNEEALRNFLRKIGSLYHKILKRWESLWYPDVCYISAFALKEILKKQFPSWDIKVVRGLDLKEDYLHFLKVKIGDKQFFVEATLGAPDEIIIEDYKEGLGKYSLKEKEEIKEIGYDEFKKKVRRIVEDFFEDEKDFCKEVNALQRAAYLVVHLAQREGFGLVITEAMGKKKPVVATKCGGIKLQIENGKSGFLVENREEAKSKILQLFENTNLARGIGEEARKRVREEFLVTKHLKRYLETFDKVLSSSSIRVRKKTIRSGSFKRRRIFKEEVLWKDLIFRIWEFLAYFLQKEVIFSIPKFLKHIFSSSFSLIGRAKCTESLKTGGFFLLRKPLLLSRERWKNIKDIFTVSHNYFRSTSSAIEISIDEVSLGLLILFNRPLYIKDVWRWTDKMRKILRGIIKKSLSDEGLLEETVKTIFPDLDLSKVSKVNVIALGSGKESEPEKIGSESIFKVSIDNKGDFSL